jgi:cytoskeletal protein RodZ
MQILLIYIGMASLGSLVDYLNNLETRLAANEALIASYETRIAALEQRPSTASQVVATPSASTSFQRDASLPRLTEPTRVQTPPAPQMPQAITPQAVAPQVTQAITPQAPQMPQAPQAITPQMPQVVAHQAVAPQATQTASTIFNVPIPAHAAEYQVFKAPCSVSVGGQNYTISDPKLNPCTYQNQLYVVADAAGVSYLCPPQLGPGNVVIGFVQQPKFFLDNGTVRPWGG